MAFIESLKSYHISLANIEAGIYEDFSFKMARYEGEPSTTVFLRLVSFSHSYNLGRKLVVKDGVWLVESKTSTGDSVTCGIIGAPDWKSLDHELRGLTATKNGNDGQISLYLISPEDYLSLLHRVKSRKLKGIEHLKVFTIDFDEAQIDTEQALQGDSWEVLIVDDTSVQLSIKTREENLNSYLTLNKRDVWMDYQSLLQELAQGVG